MQNNIPIWIQVHPSQTTSSVLSKALEQLAIAVSLKLGSIIIQC